MQQPKARLWPAYVACYVLLALLVVLGMYTLFIWRWTLLTMLPIVLPRSLWQQFIYGATMLLMGIVLFIGVLVAEHQLRTSVPQRRLLRRFANFALPMAGVAILGLLLLWLFAA